MCCRMETKLVKVLEETFYEKQSSTLCLAWRKGGWANLTALYSFLSFLLCHRTQGNSAKLHHGRFALWDGAQTWEQVS